MWAETETEPAGEGQVLKGVDMTEKEAELRKQLEEEAKVWVKEEFTRRFAIAKETMEKQGRETEEHLRQKGIKETGRIASETQMSISYAKSELYKDVQFEADNWVEEELKKRLNETNGWYAAIWCLETGIRSWIQLLIAGLAAYDVK